MLLNWDKDGFIDIELRKDTICFKSGNMCYGQQATYLCQLASKMAVDDIELEFPMQ